ncbi:IucA/IucC family protein [Streptomyces sp. SPB162]|uniref:IucA/IucC family protein n=1 Tax=Streptomyces sp. SPB162 TaxID=2940560 RepID=UPI002406CCD7|nr:IucA/IucC family protein [Streptomyces sp. SPB162]MDF9816074.1 siderophore synthetase component [Streptomyces sp. SPB162]
MSACPGTNADPGAYSTPGAAGMVPQDTSTVPVSPVGTAVQEGPSHVPPQTRRIPSPHAGPDPLEAPDAYAAADSASIESLLRCWVRENGLTQPRDGVLRVALPASATGFDVGVRHWSATGHHRFGRVRLAFDQAPLAAVCLAALLAREAGTDPAGGTDLIGRVADSARRTARFITDRRERPEAPAGTDPFLETEQSLILGHPLHPTPKGREGLSEVEARAYSPELRGSFPLHWFAVDRSLIASDSAWTVRGRTVPAERLLADLAGPGLDLPDGAAALPLHPWQAREVRHRPEVRELLETGRLRDLGPLGEPWHPTSSVRTVYRSGAPAMLKLSLALRITNSRRENLRKELRRGTEVHRLLRSGLAERWRAAHPGFDIVRDPAWLAVNEPGGEPLQGLDVVLRHNPFGPGDQAHCLAGLTSPRPWPGLPEPALRSRLADLVGRLAGRTGRPPAAVAAEWFLRYLDAVVRPVLWLDGEAGVALEAHQQNTLVLLDAHGWPSGGRYRDNQGYYFRESHRTALERRLPGIGAESDTFVPDSIADERFAYYLGINNVLGLIGAFGSQELADESLLLAAFRRFLGQMAATGRSRLPAQLLGAATLRCKANLLTRLHGMDELVGPVDTQSVYVTIRNPLAA